MNADIKITIVYVGIILQKNKKQWIANKKSIGHGNGVCDEWEAIVLLFILHKKYL